MTTMKRRDVSHRGQEGILELPHRRRVDAIRWVSIVLTVYLAAVVLNLLVFNSAWNWPLVADYLFSQRIILGLVNTVILTVLAVVLGISLGLVICACRLSRYAILRSGAFLFIWVVRATPMLVILLIIYFLGVLRPTLGIGIPFLPYIFQWPTNDLVTPFTAAVGGLSLYLGGKTAEIFRSGFIAVSAGQRDAARALALPPHVALLRVYGPQAVRVLIPPLSNEVVTMFKNTSLVSVIGFAELLTTTQRLYAVNFHPLPMLTVACIWYLALTSLLMVGQMALEKRFSRGHTRALQSKRPKSAGLGPAVPVTTSLPLSSLFSRKRGSQN